MPRRRLLALTCALTSGLGLLAATPALAGPAHPVAAAQHRAAARPVPAAARPGWFAQHRTRPTALASASQRRAAVRAAARPRLHPHLAPGVTTQLATRDGKVRVTVGGSRRTVHDTVQRLGGRVLAATDASSVAAVPRTRVAQLADASGVTRVAPVNHPYAADVTPGPSQAVQASGADVWHPQDPDTGVYSGNTGAGAKLAIVDLGFATQDEYDAEVTAGHLGANTQVDPGDCTTPSSTDPTAFDGETHGLAVAEIAQQQAPDATLYLYCVDSPEGLSAAVDKIVAAGIPIASSSIGWFQDSRGDGTGSAGSVASSIKRARQAGVLWINSAGNEVPQHYSGVLADANHDSQLDMGNHDGGTYPYESNFYVTAPGSTGSPTSMAFIFQWDEWPTPTHSVTLEAYGVQCHSDFIENSTTLDGCNGTEINNGTPLAVSSANDDTAGPSVGLDTAEQGQPNTLAYPQVWEVFVHFNGTFLAGRHYDLFGEGDADGASSLSCPSSDTDGYCIFSAAAKSGSVVAPANSPYALAVGAASAGADNGGDGQPTGTLEYFSSQGPTIDGRVKPDITGWDGLSSYVSGFEDGFYGTSAAAPSVAGAAVLVKSVDPTMDAAQLQTFLEQRADAGTPNNPPNNQTGYGVLSLGATTGVAAPAGTRYSPLAAPKRILDTRTTTGGHHGRLGANGVLYLTIPGLPLDATAVAVNLTGVNTTSTGTYLSAYPAGPTYPSTSNLNLTSTDRTAAVFAIVKVARSGTNGSVAKIAVRNRASSVDVIVDELGYFGTSATTGRYTGLATPRRALDTRTSTGGHKYKLGNGSNVWVSSTSVPPGSSAAVVNVTALGAPSSGYLSVTPTCSTAVSTLNYGRYTRANLVFAQLANSSTTPRFCIHNKGPAVDVLVDVAGYLGPNGADYYPLAASTRVVDTRTGNGGSAGGTPSRTLTANATTAFYGSNVGAVPSAATALFTGLAETNTGGSYLAIFPGATTPPSVTSNLNFSSTRTVANAAVTGLSNHTFGLFSRAGAVNAMVDVFGYFLQAP